MVAISDNPSPTPPNLIDRDEVMRIAGIKSVGELLNEIAAGRVPRHLDHPSPWVCIGLKPNGRKDWKWDPRWSRVQVLDRVAHVRIAAQAEP